MPKKKGSQKASSPSLVALCPSPSAPSYIDRLAPELKIQILETCNELGGKPLLLPLASTCTEFRRMGEPLIFGDLKFEMDKSKPTPKDPDFNLSDVDYQAFLPFRWHAKKHGHLIKSIYLELAEANAAVQPQLVTSMMRWNFFSVALEDFTALKRLDIDCFSSFIDRDDLDGDNTLLDASSALGRTLTSLRLVGPRLRYPMSATRVAELVVNLPLLTSLHVENIGGAIIGMHEGPELRDAITTLHHLKELRVVWAHGNTLAGAKFEAPLEMFECEGLTASELLDVIRPIASTIHSLKCREGANGPHPLPTSPSPSFPRLRHLSLHVNVNLAFLDYFSSSPLEVVRCMQGDDFDIVGAWIEIDEALERANLAAIRRFIRTHKDHLQQLDVQVLRESIVEVIKLNPEAHLVPTNWRRVVAPWEEIAELCETEGLKFSHSPWR